jgi:hypothetical protein
MQPPQGLVPAPLSILNAQIAAAAAIASSKLADGAHFTAAAPHSGHPVHATISWTGTDTQNRAIAHGLGRKPKMFIIAGGSGETSYLWVDGMGAQFKSTANNNMYAVTECDATNIYTGSGGAPTEGNISPTEYDAYVVA